VGVGIAQMLAAAKREDLDVEGVVEDIVTHQPQQEFDLVIPDRVLHMLPEAARLIVLTLAMDAVVVGGHLLVAEGPKGVVPVREAIEQRGWSLVRATRNRLIARRQGELNAA